MFTRLNRLKPFGSNPEFAEYPHAIPLNYREDSQALSIRIFPIQGSAAIEDSRF
jgi:hypothetical protein